MRLIALAVLTLILLPSTSRAWTEAEIETLSARIDVSENADIRVHMTLRLHVRGGWLERLEIAGLDEGYTLDEESIVFRGEGSPRYPRVVRRDDGRLQFNFERRAAPRRGNYEVSFDYEASVSASARTEGTHARYDWTLPGWRTGLDGVEIELRGPRSLEFAASEDVLATIAKERTEDDETTTLRWHRAHLPRTVPWTIGFTFGGAATEASSDVSNGEHSASPLATGGSPSSPAPAAPALPLTWFSLMTLLALVVFNGRARRYGATPRPLLPLGFLVRCAALVGLIASAFVTAPTWYAPIAMLLVALIGIERTPPAPTPPKLGAWRALGARARLPIVHRPWDAVFDGTSIIGLFVLGCVLAAAFSLESWGVWTLVLTLPWVTGTGRQLPIDLATKRSRLLAIARNAPAGPYALGLAVHESADGKAQDVRLRLATKHRASGLVRFDLVCAERPGPGGLYAIERILVVAREGSRAHELAAKHFTDDEGHATPGGRTVWAAAPGELVALCTLFGSRPKKKKRRQRPVRRSNAALPARP